MGSKIFWRNSASIILIGKMAKQPSSSNQNATQKSKTLKEKNFDYGILLLKRNPRSKFMASTTVFPGGALDKADLSSDWRLIFSKNECELLKQFELQNRPRPFVFSDKTINLAGSPTPTENSISMELATRICAIRETFEETGILLARREIPNCKREKLPLKYSEIFSNKNSLLEWRKRVLTNASDFLILCKEKRILPDVWALHEWSNWLTPTTFKIRFNTVFYTCFLNSTQQVIADSKEIMVAEWLTPSGAISEFREGKIELPPPQNYEIHRLAQYGNIDELSLFSKERSLQGVECIFPVVISTKDGLISVLPGDDLHPKKPDILGEKDQITLDKTNNDLLNEANHLNRFDKIKSATSYGFTVKCNVQQKCGHINPVVY